MKIRVLTAILTTALAIAGMNASGAQQASATESHDCFSRDLGRRIDACQDLLAQPDLDPTMRAQAHAMRALSLSVIGRYAEAINDYDKAIEIRPNFAVALNNRAWAHYRAGNVKAAWPDVTKSLELDPWSPHAHDTRAHLYHADGQAEAAFADYRSAMRLGGPHMVKLYQCGLQAQGHYLGPMNGLISDQLLLGLKACSKDQKCDPLPPDEECKAATS